MNYSGKLLSGFPWNVIPADQTFSASRLVEGKPRAQVAFAHPQCAEEGGNGSTAKNDGARIAPSHRHCLF